MRQVHYAAAKAGLINLTHSLAKLYSGAGITANAIAPGLVATDMIRKELKSKAGKQKAAQIPVGRIAEPEEIAAGVVYLASDAAGLCHRPDPQHQWRDVDVMKTLLILGAGKEQVAAIAAAKAKGIRTVVLDMNPKADGRALADEFHLVSTRDRDAILKFVAGYQVQDRRRHDHRQRHSAYGRGCGRGAGCAPYPAARWPSFASTSCT